MSKRPESFADLYTWDHYEELAVILVSDAAAKAGVFRAVDAAVAAFCGLHGADAIVVKFEPNRVEVRRPCSEEELAEKLRKAQESWDRRQQPKAVAS